MTRYQISTAVFIFLISSAGFAQNKSTDRKLHLGVFAGRHLIGETFTYEKLKQASGALAGLDMSYKLGKQRPGISIRLQPHYARYQRINKEHPNTDQFTVKSFNVPLLARYALGPGKIRPFLEAGLNFRWRTAFKYERNGQICSFIGPCSYGQQSLDLHKELTHDRIGLVAGVGVEVDVWQLTTALTVRVNEGVGTFRMEEQLADSYYFDQIKTRNFQVTAGISF